MKKLVLLVATFGLLLTWTACVGRYALKSSANPVRPFGGTTQSTHEPGAGGEHAWADGPAEAQEYFIAKRAPKGEHELRNQWYKEAIRQSRNNNRYSTANLLISSPESVEPSLATNATLGTWQELGPGNVGGRTRALVVDPNTPTTMYAGSVAGGIWKSTNGGGSWTEMTDLGLPNLAVTTLAMDPNNSSVIYAGTGEGFWNGDAVRGDGIFKTTDAGNTWTQLLSTATTDFYYVNKLVVSPNSSTRLYAVTRTGIWESNDGGNTWTKGVDGTIVSGCMDLAIQKGPVGAYVFGSCGTFSTNSETGIYRSVDNNPQTWTKVFSATNMGRTSLAIAPSSPNIIYAMSASNVMGTYNQALLAVFRSTSNGDSGTWTIQDDNTSGTPPPQTSAAYQDILLLTNAAAAYSACGSTSSYNQGWYDNVLAVDPTNPNVVFAGGINLFRSDNAGVNWGLMSYNVHTDNHAIVFHPGYDGSTNQTLYVGNDGGIFMTTNARAATASGFDNHGFPAACSSTDRAALTWTRLNNNYAVTQFYNGLPYPDGSSFFGGTQDNGTVRGVNGSANAWSTVMGGDGGWVAQDPTNPNTIFGEFTGLSLEKSTNNGVTFSSASSGITGDTFPFITVYRMDPGNPQRLWIGGQKMWRTNNQAASWTQATLALTTGAISAMAISSANGNYVLAGTSDGRIARTSTGLSDAAASWSFVAPQASGYVSWLEWQPGSTTTAYVTYSTFGLPSKVMKTTDGGVTWTSLNGAGANAIPDIPVTCIAIDPTNSSHLYIATDIGVFVSLDGGQNWFKENTGFANVVVDSLAFNTTGTIQLYAFTHGRGAWCVSLSPTFVREPGGLSQLSVGADGTVWGLNGLGQIFQYNSPAQNWNGIPGALNQIAVGGANSIWGLNGLGQTFEYNTQLQSWVLIPGKLTSLSIGADGDAWGLNAGQIFHFVQSAGAWTQVPGGLTRLSVGFDGAVWGIGGGNHVFRFNPGTQQFELVPGLLTQLSVGADGDVWGLNGTAIFHFNRLKQNWDPIPGGLAQIAVGSATNIWGVNTGGYVYQYNAQIAGWTLMQGTDLVQISAAANGGVWGLDSVGAIYQLNQPTALAKTLQTMPGVLVQISAAPDGNVWGVNSAGDIYIFDPLAQNWTLVPGQLAKVAVGFGGRVWGLSPGGLVFQFNSSTQTWQETAGTFAQIATGSDGSVWALNPHDQIFQYSSQTGSWNYVPGSLSQISVGADGSVWGLNIFNQIYRFDLPTQSWVQVPGALTQISIGSANNVWGVNSGYQIYQYNTANQSWNQLPGGLLQVSAAFDGEVWGINTIGDVYQYNIQAQNWNLIGGPLSQVVTGSHNVVWGLSPAGSVFRYSW